MDSLHSVNVQTDPVTFTAALKEQFSHEINQMVDIFFSRAVWEAAQGMLYSAVADSMFALNLAEYHESCSRAYLLGFLAQVHVDLSDIKKAAFWLNRGWESFDSSDPDNEDLVESFQYLEDLLSGEEWKAL